MYGLKPLPFVSTRDLFAGFLKMRACGARGFGRFCWRLGRRRLGRLGWGFRFGGESFLSLTDRFGAVFFSQGEDGFGFPRQPLKDERVGSFQFVFNLAGTKDAPSFQRDPVGFGEVGRCENSVALEELMKSFGAAMEPENADASAIEIGHGEHFSADVAVAGPIDEVMTPVHGFSGVGQREADFANALVVHWQSLTGRGRPGAPCVGWRRERVSIDASYTNPRLLEVKFPMDGNTAGSSAALTPNHWARVAAYCELAVVGTQRPFVSESSGPPSASVG